MPEEDWATKWGGVIIVAWYTFGIVAFIMSVVLTSGG